MTEARVRGGSMLWLLEDGKAPIEEKIARAVAFYEAKYGKKATRCRLDPRTLAKGEAFPVSVGEMKCLVDIRVLVGHITIGAD
jgi:hypothetical protein